MHISLENLLALRDTTADEAAEVAKLADMRDHLRSCPECSAEFARLDRLRNDMHRISPGGASQCPPRCPALHNASTRSRRDLAVDFASPLLVMAMIQRLKKSSVRSET